MNKQQETMAISEFKAKCLRVLSRVRSTGTTVLVTRRGEPMALITPPKVELGAGSWMGSMRETARITGDVVAPAADPGEWETLR